MAVIFISLLLAALLGFATHRASICTVKATAELLSTGRAFMFASFAKTAAWIFTVSTLLIWLGAAPRGGGLDASPVTVAAMIGGFIFGLGAALNGGCAFATLNKLAEGEARMALTLMGFMAGALAMPILVSGGAAPPATPLVDLNSRTAGLLALALVGLLVVEAWRLWRSRARGARWRDLLLADSYRLSSAAVLIGIANGVLYLLHGRWTYTGTLNAAAGRILGAGEGPDAILWALFGAVFVGMVASAAQRRALKINLRPEPLWLRNLGGGLLMGIGAALVPGGNDELVLHAVPTFSPHALPAFGAMVAGIAVMLGGVKALTGREMRVECGGDICRTS